MLAGGASSKEIAAILGISPRTVVAHIETLFRKAGVGKRAQLVAWAFTEGYMGEIGMGMEPVGGESNSDAANGVRSR